MAVAAVQPYTRAIAITKSDTVNFDGTTTSHVTAGTLAKALPCDAIYVGGAGVVVAVMEDSSTSSITAVAGGLLPIKAIRVNSTNTTATVMTALYYV